MNTQHQAEFLEWLEDNPGYKDDDSFESGWGKCREQFVCVGELPEGRKIYAVSLSLPSTELREPPREAFQARDQWRDAVINELVVSHLYTKEHDNNPRKAIEDVINWNVEVALDPMVSQGARDLIDQGGKCDPHRKT